MTAPMFKSQDNLSRPGPFLSETRKCNKDQLSSDLPSSSSFSNHIKKPTRRPLATADMSWKCPDLHSQFVLFAKFANSGSDGTLITLR